MRPQSSRFRRSSKGGWLDKSSTEGWSTSQLRVELRKAKRPKVSEGTTAPEPPPKVHFNRARLERVATEVLELEQTALDADLTVIVGHLSDAYQHLWKAIEVAEDLS